MKRAKAHELDDEDTRRAESVLEKMQLSLNAKKVQTNEDRVHALADAGEENDVAQRIAEKMLAIKRAKGKAKTAGPVPVAPPKDPFPESEGWL